MRACRRAFGKKWKHPKERNSFFPSVISENEAAAYPGHWEISKRRSCRPKKVLTHSASASSGQFLPNLLHPPTYSRPAWHAFALPCKECGSLLHQCYTFYIPQCVTILATSYWGNDALQGRYVGEVRKYSEKTKDIFVIRKAATGSLKGKGSANRQWYR